MTGNLCRVCEQSQQCKEFGISNSLASRLMIAKSAQREGECFPINVYLEELKDEGLDSNETLAFIETVASHCIYVNTL